MDDDQLQGGGIAAVHRTLPMAQLRIAGEKTSVPAIHVAGVTISHPERPIAEAPGHTKLDVVRYHERMGRWLLPQVSPRPIAVVKCMGGRFDDCFFQKHPSRRNAEEDDDSPPFMRLADVADIVRAVQNGGFEFHTWGAAKTFARAMAERLVQDEPALFTATVSKEARVGRVYVDYLRNADGATAVAAYSLRARPGLPVSMPIDFDELAGDDLRGAHFNIDNAEATLAERRADPWVDYETSRQTISATMRRAVGA